MISVIWNAIVSPMDVIGQRDVKHRPEAALATVLLAAVLGAVAVPVASRLASAQAGTPTDIGGMALVFVVSVATWLAVGGALRLVAMALHMDIRFKQLTSVWGLSYLPNILCLILYTIALAAPALWRGNDVSSFAFATLFILCLAWKAIYYFMVVRLVFQASLAEFLVMTAFLGVVFAALALLGAQLGIQVPML
jgi:hypothetical protein